MPLRRGSSRDVIHQNVHELIQAGHPIDQAVAIALRQARAKCDRRRRSRDTFIMLTPPGREPIGGITGLMVDAFAGADPYTPPPGPGTAQGHYGQESDPAAVIIGRPGRAAAPDPRTAPLARGDARRIPRRLPRQIPPARHEQDYATALVGMMKRVRVAWAPVIRAVPALIEQAHAAARGDSARLDAGETGKIKAMVASAVEATRRAVKRDDVEALARKFAERTSTYQRLQLSRQVRSALGADPVFRDKGLSAKVDQFSHENAALVTRIPERLHGDLEALVTRAVSSGRPHPGLADQIEERFGVAERHARLIARDQVSKFYGSLNHARQAEMGVTKFVWRTAGDERVREEHQELDGQEFDYDDPPAEGLPSEPVNCRCWSEPIFEDLEDEDEDEGDDQDETDDEE